MIAELRAEKEAVEQAIVVLERLATGSGGKRRGRPPKWLSETKSEAPLSTKKRGRPRKQPGAASVNDTPSGTSN